MAQARVQEILRGLALTEGFVGDQARRRSTLAGCWAVDGTTAVIGLGRTVGVADVSGITS